MRPYQVIPERQDILCGSGERVNSHEGNQLFCQVLQRHYDIYARATSKPEKIEATRLVYNDVLSNGSRFLKREAIFDRWRLVERKAARDKISHCLRKMKRANERKKTTRGPKEAARSSYNGVNMKQMMHHQRDHPRSVLLAATKKAARATAPPHQYAVTQRIFPSLVYSPVSIFQTSSKISEDTTHRCFPTIFGGQPGQVDSISSFEDLCFPSCESGYHQTALPTPLPAQNKNGAHTTATTRTQLPLPEEDDGSHTNASQYMARRTTSPGSLTSESPIQGPMMTTSNWHPHHPEDDLLPSDVENLRKLLLSDSAVTNHYS